MTLLQGHKSPPSAVCLCQGCGLTVDVVELPHGKSAYCPRCGTQLYRGGNPSLSGNLAIAITCLILFIPSLFFSFISIRLIGVMIPASLPQTFVALYKGGYGALALLVMFCSTAAPLMACISVVTAHVALHYRQFRLLKLSLSTVHALKHWVMIDVFLASIAVSCFKLKDYSDIFVGPGLYGLALLQLSAILLVSRISIRRYWEAWNPETTFTFSQKEIHCQHCHLSQPLSPRCQRCHSPLHARKPDSIQKTWALVIAASIAIIPANLLPISILIKNGQRLEDTIFSGVSSLVSNGMYLVAIIIFVASILVPVGKILGMLYLLITIHFRRGDYHHHSMAIYGTVKWIGKWSVMDLFVIAIMMTLIDRGRILDFTPGPGAIAFGVVVVLTMLATESFDPRYIWDNHPDTDNNNGSVNE